MVSTRKAAAKTVATKKVPTKKAPAKKASAKKAAGPPLKLGAALAATSVTFDQLEQVKTDLEAISEKLNGIDPDTLSEAQRKDWSHEMDRVDLAIMRARNALQRNLLDAFEGEVDAIGEATGKLAESLDKLNKVVQVIEAVAGVLGVIEKVITLAR